MTIRWKLNLSIVALIAVFLAAAGFSMWAVSINAEQTRIYSRMRDLSQFTADLRTQIYQQLAVTGGIIHLREAGSGQDWLRFSLEHIDIQIRLAEVSRERDLWTKVRSVVAELNDALGPSPKPGMADELVARAERDLQELRSYYDLAQYESVVETARTSFLAQAAVGVACLLTVLLFLIDLIMVRKWFVRPIEILKTSAETIGQGRLDHRVPLTGHDELAQLARCVDAMAEHLAQHQAALIKARELSTLGELCANVAHGLRNPLAALRASAQLAEMRVAGSTESQSLIRELAQQVDRMDQRITRLFEFSRPLDPRPGATAIDEIARAVQAQVSPLLRTRQITLQIEDRTDGVLCRLDGEQLAQSLAELVTNAVHHSADGEVVTLRAELVPPHNGTGRRIRVEVIDRGSGMAPVTLHKAFDLFFTSRPEGTGMGLALVRRFVERNAGDIALASTLGAGTTVTITLPADECR